VTLRKEAALMGLHFLGLVKLTELPDAGSQEKNKPAPGGRHAGD